MARPKIIRKAEEAKDIDPSLSIQVELPPEGEIELNPEQKAEEDRLAAELAAKKAQEKEDRGEDETMSLKQQLEDMKKTSDFYKTQAEEAGKREAEARKLADTHSSELKTTVTRADQAEYDSIVNAISAVTSEAERAEQDLKIAGEAQDWGALAKAQAMLSRANTRLVQLEDGKASLETRAERAKETAKNPPPAGDPIQAHIDSIPGLFPAQREWLGKHRELMTDPKKNIRLQNAHIDAEEAGHPAGSEAYFKFMEERLGYRKVEAPVRNNDEEDDADTNERPPIVSAPPSRDPPSAGTGKQTPTRITLSPDERAHAAASGISEIEYARQKLKLAELKKTGHYGEH